MSSRRVWELGLLGLKFFGISMKGTSVSSWAKAGTAQSGTKANRLPAARPVRNTCLRLIGSDILISCSGELRSNDPNDHINSGHGLGICNAPQLFRADYEFSRLMK